MRPNANILLLVQLALVAGLGLALRRARRCAGRARRVGMGVDAVRFRIHGCRPGDDGPAGVRRVRDAGLAQSRPATAGKGREAGWFASLVVAAVAVQGVLASGAPAGYGLAKMVRSRLHDASSSGYFTVAREEIRDPWQFLLGLSEVGSEPAHPSQGWRTRPACSCSRMPRVACSKGAPASSPAFRELAAGTVRTSFRQINDYDPMPMPDRAALGPHRRLSRWSGCASTVLPLYLLARSCLPSQIGRGPRRCSGRWLPSDNACSSPRSDPAFPFFSPSALALRAGPARSGPVPALTMGRPLRWFSCWRWLAVHAGVLAGRSHGFALVFASAADRSRRQRPRP